MAEPDGGIGMDPQRRKRKTKDRYKDQREPGGYVPMAHCVLRSQSWSRLSPYAVKLLMDLLSRYSGSNNGDLCATWSLMKMRGWRSPATLDKARRELLDGGWLKLARQGGRNRASLYAVTMFNVDECGGKLDIPATHRPSSEWRKLEPPPKLTIASRRDEWKEKTLLRQADQRRHD